MTAFKAQLSVVTKNACQITSYASALRYRSSALPSMCGKQQKTRSADANQTCARLHVGSESGVVATRSIGFSSNGHTCRAVALRSF